MTIYNSLSSAYQKLNHYHQDDSKNHPITENNHPNPPSSPILGTAWYVCGPTVYDSAHLGHGRTYVSLDILRRVALSLHDSGSSSSTPRPIYVMNITDVDDKIIQRTMDISDYDNGGAIEKLSNPLSLARYYEMEFWQDMDSLNVLRPDVVCRVSEHVEQTIIPYIEMILEGGMAYVIPEEDGGDGEKDCIGDDGSAPQQRGSVYFDVRAFEYVTKGRTKYGKLAPDVASSDFFSWDESYNNNGSSNNNSNNDEGESPNQVQKKRDPRDFCLWKYRSQSAPTSSSSSIDNTPPMIEPAIVSYSSPWGPGRPGWHVECSAMIQRLSVDFQSTHKFQLHAGGIDLKFPHHSNEIAQAEAFHEAVMKMNVNNGNERKLEEWIPNWIHTGHLYVKGRKMSKSLKNFVTIREMLGSSSDNSNEGVEMTASHQNQYTAWSCPSDDFRLWCLGLSGSYRGPATYSTDRMEEARVIRTKWVKFLIEGQQCLDKWQAAAYNYGDGATDSSSSQSTKVWGADDLQLFNQVTQSRMKCHDALVGRCTKNHDGSSRGSFDLDGASFVKELSKLADSGLGYVQRTATHKPHPEEPLRFTLETFRRQLDLVGFTSYTVRAGISTDETQTLELASLSNSTMLDEIVAFRSAVRSATLKGLRSKDTTTAANEVLELCDKLRDDIFPSLGVELVDGKVADVIDGKRAWRRCSPRNVLKK
jgi:cysteinyl-tRNA synthetase